MSTDLDIIVNETGDRVTATGELDASTGPRLRGAVLEMLASSDPGAEASKTPLSSRRVLDLSGVSFIASAGLALLLELDARASAVSLVLVTIVDPEGLLLRMLERTGLASQLTIEPADADHASS